jgi:tetratricopeptide (TPR) repeat protein
VAFSPDGRLALTGSEDNTARLWEITPAAPDEPERLQAWVHVRTRKWFNDTGILRDLAQVEWLQRLRNLKALGGEWEVSPPARTWHVVQADAAKVDENWFASPFHLSRLLAEDRDNPDLLRCRAAAHACLQQWPSAIADYTRVIERQPDNATAWGGRANARASLNQWPLAIDDFEHAARLQPDNGSIANRLGLALLGGGDRTAYRSQCRRMLERFGQTVEAGKADDVAFLAVLQPVPGDNAEPILRLARLAVAKAPDDAHYRETFGAALYRAGRFEEAVKELDTAVERQKKGGSVWMQLFLALAHHRLQHTETAQAWLTNAVEQIDATYDPGWQNKVRWKLLRQEAEDLLKSPPPARRDPP